MKKHLKFFTIIIASMITITSTYSVLGATNTSFTIIKAEKKKPVIAEKEVIAPLKIKSTAFYNDTKQLLGHYPVISSMEGLNKKILDTINENINEYTASEKTKISFSVESNERFSTIIVNSQDLITEKKDTNIYYVDKKAGFVITKEEMDKLLLQTSLPDTIPLVDLIPAKPVAISTPNPDAKPQNTLEPGKTNETASPVPVTTEKAENVEMLPIRLFAEALDFEVLWNKKDSTISIIKDNFITSVTVDKNEYLVDGEVISLGSAPVFINNSVCVPAEFFTKVLGATKSISNKGEIIFNVK